jgi:hypothetical protein
MNEESGKKPERANPPPEGQLTKRAEAIANLQRALDSMARLRRTIDERPGGLTWLRKTTGR